MGKLITATALIGLVLASGCTRSSNALSVNTQPPPQPLPSQPAGSLETGQLDPISQDQATQDPSQIAQPEAPTVGGEPTASTETASLDTSAAEAKPLNHEQLAGAWNVGTDGVGCRVFLSFTQWSGGYRAGSRNCTSPELSSVSAWDVKGSQVVLVDSNGTQVASLGSAGSERYSGTTSSGKPVSFSR